MRPHPNRYQYQCSDKALFFPQAPRSSVELSFLSGRLVNPAAGNAMDVPHARSLESPLSMG